jgi:DNA repair exonuclease SbcCD ATPase subunit
MTDPTALTREQIEEQCLVEAAQCWCEPTTSHLPMQSEVSAVFARKLADTIDDLTAKLAAMKQERDEALRMVNVQIDCTNDGTRHIQRLQQELANLRQNYEERGKTLSQVENDWAVDVETLEQQLTTLQARLAAMEQERDELHRILLERTEPNRIHIQSLIEESNHAARQQLSTLQARLAEVEGILRETQEKLDI